MELEGQKKRKHADASDILKWAIVAEYNFYRRDHATRLDEGIRQVICDRFNVSPASMNRYVEEWESQREINIIPDLSVKRDGKCGASNTFFTEELMDCMFELSYELKGSFTYESFTKPFNDRYEIEPRIHTTTIFRWFKKLEVVETMSYIKPQLQDKHVIRRLDFILNKLEPTGHGIFRIKDQSRHIHIDEKWFFAVREHKKIKLLPGQKMHHETTRHKSHILKVMFIAAIGMPQTMPDGINFFDGKIGLFPVVAHTVAKRKSKNRDAGADVVENVSMTAAQYLHMMTNPAGLLAAVRQKMPWAQNDNIVLQHDNAPGHKAKDIQDALAAAGQQDGWNITFEAQPAQSPDTNLCDLLFFNSLQKRSFELRSKSNSPQELMDTVQQAWEEYHWKTLERGWGHLFATYRAILDAEGTNMYERPHSGVTERQRAGAGTLDPYVSMESYLTGMEARDALIHAN